MLSEQERWQPEDLVLAADLKLWVHANAERGFVWDRLTADGSVESRVFTYPVRPLTLLVRSGQACSGITNAGHRELRARLLALAGIWEQQARTDHGLPSTELDRQVLAAKNMVWNTAVAELRTLLLVFRDGQVYSGITNGQGDPVPAWVSRASTAALESQLADVTGEYQALVAMLIPAVSELTMAALKATRVIPDGEIQRGCVLLDGVATRDRLRAAVYELIKLRDEAAKR